ncbi:MAG TPA: outer membrane lipoprotein chaperone LolA [Acidobacteriaceae bacterium]|nr:outer membrane lipoprotein chaperone LolA [Acidobacteriaceae bacterium]
MKKTPLLLAVFACLLLPGFVRAQSLSVKDLASRVDHHYNALHSLQINFTQHYQGMGMDRRESGVLLLKKSGRMRWTYSNPAGKLFILDGHNAYFYSPGQTTAQRVPAKELSDLRSPISLLLGHTKLEKELHGLTMEPAANGLYMLTGVPKGMENRVASLRLTVTPDGVIRSMEVDETDGVRNTFHFSNAKPNAPAPDSAFVFTPPAGVQVVEGMPPV